MNGEDVVVDARDFERLCGYYSGDLLGENKCKAVSFAGKLWTVTGISTGGKRAPSVSLHELVPHELYTGPTGVYPCKMDGVFYKGQLVQARGGKYVLTGRRLLAVQESEQEAKRSGLQLDLFGEKEVAT